MAVYGIIYLVTNTLNGKVYIGQTTQSLVRRWRQHRCVRNGKLSHLQHAIAKYGESRFVTRQLEACSDKDSLNTREMYWIQQYQSTHRSKGYNRAQGGSNAPKSEATKVKLSEIGKRKASTPEGLQYLINMSRSFAGTPEGRKKISEASKNRSVTTRQKHSRNMLTKLEDAEFRAELVARMRKAQAASAAKKKVEWVSEEVLRERLQGLSVKQYRSVRHQLGPNFPKQNRFVEIYGKTFRELRDGYRNNDYVSEEVLRAFIQGIPQPEYARLSRLELPDRFPLLPVIRRVYGKSYVEIRDGK